MTSTQTNMTNTSAAYWSETDLNLITNGTVKVIVNYILEKLSRANISYRARVRSPERIQVIKIRSIETSSEIVILIPNNQDDTFEIRFIDHADRYTTTTPSRIVIRRSDFKYRGIDPTQLCEYIDENVLTWLAPRQDNLKPSQVPMLVLENTPVCPSSLVAIGFVIEHANIVSSNGDLTATISNRDKTIVRSGRVLPGVVLSNRKENLTGRIYVEFYNGDYLFMTEKVFVQQFRFFRAGMVDMSIKH